MVRELFQESASIACVFFCWGKFGKIVGESCKDMLYVKAGQPISSKFSRPNQVGWSLCKKWSHGVLGFAIKDIKGHLVDLDFQGTMLLLGGGFKYFLFSLVPGEMIQFD